MKNLNLAGVSKETWARLAVLIATLINQLLVTLGKTPFAEDALAELISCIITIVVAVYCYWKNNSFTKKAQKADEELKK